MADVWFVKEGSNPTGPQPYAQLALAECIAKLGLEPGNFLGKAPQPKRSDPMQDFRAFRYVDVEIDEVEASTVGWEAGFYRLSLTPEEVSKQLKPSR